MRYIYQYPDWTKFRYKQKVTTSLGRVRMAQGYLTGIASLALDKCDAEECSRRDLAASFEAESAELSKKAFDTFMGASRNFQKEISEENLLEWHAACVKGGGHFRTSESAEPGVEPERIAKEISLFLKFFNVAEMDYVLKAAIAHFWFLTICPFEKGNKAIAGLLSDIQLSRSENSHNRFYSLFSELLKNPADYAEKLLKVQQGDGEITEWLLWFIEKLNAAIECATNHFSPQFSEAAMSLSIEGIALSDRKMRLLKILRQDNGFLQNSSVEISSSEWAKLSGITHDSALRDLTDLVEKGILKKTKAKGRSTRYRLVGISSQDEKKEFIYK